MTISGYWRRGLRPLPSSGSAPLYEGEGRRGEVEDGEEEDLDAGEDGSGVGEELDVGFVGEAEDEAVGGEEPGPEEERAFLAGPESGELVGAGEGAVGVLHDVGDGEVVGEDGVDEGESGGGDGDETGDAGAAGGVCEALGGDGGGLAGGDEPEGHDAGEKIVGGERQSNDKSEATKCCHERLQPDSRTRELRGEGLQRRLFLRDDRPLRV